MNQDDKAAQLARLKRARDIVDAVNNSTGKNGEEIIKDVVEKLKKAEEN